VRVKVVKNKVAPPFREGYFVNIHGQGILHEAEIIDQALKLDLVQKSGSWYAHDNNKLGQGFEAATKYLMENKKLANKLEAEIRKSFGV
ncbi:MAG: DNA recombination/repair protein RecA, partial [Candidatus Margulisbacteria bacterium]|nr:DNA recombination/repair protein RecA [Candidatus Margulisiibacteriota bacterium]